MKSFSKGKRNKKKRPGEIHHPILTNFKTGVRTVLFKLIIKRKGREHYSPLGMKPETKTRQRPVSLGNTNAKIPNTIPAN